VGAVPEKVALACNVTLPEDGTTTLRLLKVAVDPVKVVVPKGVPLLSRVIPLIPVDGVPVPESDRVTLVNVTGEALGLLTINWITDVLDTPGNWVELGGAEGPVDTITVSGVGVGLLVGVGVKVMVGVLVGVGVAVAIVTVASARGNPLKLTGCPVVPFPALRLKL
jgi:hypothetical protein